MSEPRELTTSELLNEFKDELKRLSSTNQEQLLYLDNHNYPIQELCDEFLDAYSAYLPRLKANAMLSTVAQEAAEATKTYVTSMLHSEDAEDLFTVQGLERDSRWRRLRELAADAHHLLQ